MKTVWKFRVPIDAHERRVSIEVPAGAIVLHVDKQAAGGGVEEAFLWALVDPSAASENLPLYVATTGAPLPEGLGDHLGTAVMYDGTFVLHIFEGRPNPFQGSF